MTDEPAALIEKVKDRDRRFRIAEGIFFIVVLLALATLAFLSIRNSTDTNHLLDQQAKTLSTLNAQAKQRDHNLELLIQDNAKQTVILCTLIVNGGQDLSDSDT